MNSPKANSSPSFKNLRTKQKQSPIAIKEKIRKDYKHKVQNCRDILLTRFRGSAAEPELRDTLTTIYKNMFNFSALDGIDEEESSALEEIQNELIEEEIQWWMEEYEKSQMNDLDWSTLQQENVICPVCQTTNFIYEDSIISCPHCNIKIKTQNCLLSVRKIIFDTIERHNTHCNKVAQFTTVSELNETHIYLICDDCMDMQLVI